MNKKTYFTNINTRLKTAILAVTATLATFQARSIELTDTISLPVGTVEGWLPNGLHYLILPNDNPVGRTEFRLVWKVGSVQQDDSQGGCAHFLEHIAFGGTDNFPNHAAVSYLESLGMKYGIDINAYTGFDRTIYMYATPSDTLKATAYSRPLSIIRDWTEHMTINPDRVETEKGIILEELRSTVQEDPFYDLKIGQGRFRDRMPLGEIEDIRNMTAKTLSDYYRKWYLPRHGAVVIVGDVDPAAMEAEIKRQFSDLKPGGKARHTVYPLTYTPSRQIMLDVDTLTTYDKVEIMISHPSIVTRTLADARRKEMGNILIRLITQRFNKQRVNCEVSNAWYLSSTDHLVFTIKESNRQPLDPCIMAVSNGITNILVNGFDDNEVADACKTAANRLRRRNFDRQSSAIWCDDFADYIISGDRYITAPDEIEALAENISNIKPDELQSLLQEWMDYRDSTMLIAVNTSPEKAPERTITNVEMAWMAGEKAPLTPYKYEAPAEVEEVRIETPDVLKQILPFDKREIASTTDFPSLGLRRVELKNGITLLLRPTHDNEGSVAFTSIAPGGYASIPVSERPMLDGVASYIDMGGIAKATANMGEYMYQNDMSLSLALENNWHGFMGAFKAGDASKYFNFVYEKIVDPELRYNDFEEIRTSMLEDDGDESVLIKMLNRAPDRMLSARLDELMGNTLNSRQEKLTKEQIKQLDLDRMARFFTTLYSTPQNSTYIMCGDFDPDSITRAFVPVFSRFKRVKSPRYSAVQQVNLPTSTVVERFPNENPTQTMFDYLYYGTYKPCLRNALIIKIMSNILRNHAIADLRERESLVYSPYVGLAYEGIPRGYYYFDLSASVDNENMDRANDLIKKMIIELRTAPVTDTELNSLKQAMLIAKREALTDYAAAAWRTNFTSLVKNNESIEDFARYDEILDSITTEDIRQAFNDYIDPDRFVLLYISDKEYTPIKK